MDLKEKLAPAIAAALDMDEAEIAAMLETPPNPKMGDAAFPCFKLKQKLGKEAADIAQELHGKMELPFFVSEAKVVGGYLNFYYDRIFYAQTVLGQTVRAGEDYGKSDMGAGKTVVIDYSSINIAKPFHIGHLSSTAIGSALYKLYKYLGYDAVGVNHLGDWGTQFGKLIAAYKLWGDDAKIERESMDAMLELYVRFHKEAEADPELDEQGRMWFKKIEDGDEEALRIFKWFSDLTLREANKVYDLLGVEFDSYAGESFYNDMLPAVIKELKEKNLLEESEGAYVVRLNEYDLPPAVVLKTDGATLYITRDIAAAKYRRETYDFFKCLYVVAYQQNLHFRQLFAVLEKMGYKWSEDMEHVAFGMVSLKEGTISTREGKVVFLTDVLNKAVEKTLAIINEKSPDLQDKELVASDVGIGAVIYSTLSQSRIKDIKFSFERVLDFDGETGPYVQYTHARCNSILQNWQPDESKVETDVSVLDNKEALAVLKLLESFPSSLLSAAQDCEPFYVTRHITKLAQAFNSYYYAHRIIDEGEAQTNARVMLTAAVKNVIKRGLGLLGIKAPNRM